MRNWRKRMAASLLTAVMAVGVVANVTPASAATLTAKQYFAKMNKVSKNAKSYETTQTTIQKMSEAGQSATFKTTVKQIVFQNPLKGKSVTTTTAKGNGIDKSSKSTVYMKEDSKGNIFEYVSTDGSEYEEIDITDIYKNASEIDTSLYSDAKIVKKSVKVNKIDAVQISAKIKGKDMGKALSMIGMDNEQMSALGIDYNTLDPIKVTIWIDKKTYFPIKATTDMTAFSNSLMKSMYGSLGADIDIKYLDAKSTTTYKNFNKATSFKFPKF